MNKSRIGAAVAIGLAAVTFASIPASAATSADTPSSSQSAVTSNLKWIRGTAVTVANDSGSPVQVGTHVGSSRQILDVETHPLSAGSKESVADEWQSVLSSEVFVKVVFADGLTAHVRLANAWAGYPTIAVQDPTDTSTDWWEAKKTAHNFDEGESWVFHFDNGRSITFTRQADDADGHYRSKVWSMNIQ